MAGTLLQASPGGEPVLLDSLSYPDGEVGRLLRQPGAVILVGERLGAIDGGLSAAQRLAETTGARLAWIPRRAGDRAAVEVGAVPGLLPGGRPVSDPAAREDISSTWSAELPTEHGLSATQMLGSDSALGALLIGGVDLADMPDPDAARAAVQSAGFVVSLEIRHSSVTELADVVFPVAAVAEKPGTFIDWEGRERPFETALRTTGVMPDQRVLQAIATEMGISLGLPDAATAHAEILALGTWSGKRVPAPRSPASARPEPQPGEAVLSSWHLLLDRGRLQDGDPNLAGTAHEPVVRLCASTATEIGAIEGQPVSVSSGRGTITLPLAITDLPPRVVWLPLNSTGSEVNRTLGVSPGDIVAISNQVPQ